MKTRITLLICCLAFSGCVPIRYSEYTGKDNISNVGTWRTGSGTMADTSYAVPVYRGWPEKDYQVLGSLSIPDPNKRWEQDDGIIRAAAIEAKRRHADAIVIRVGGEAAISAIADTTKFNATWMSFQTTALAIRWLTSDEIREREKRLDTLLKGLRFLRELSQPSENRTVGELVVTFLVQSGFDLNSQEFPNRFEETMAKLVNRNPGSPAGEWIYKSTYSISSSLSANNDDNVSVGLATVSQDGENLTIVSSAGKQEINFTGILSKGRLAGEIGVGQFSAKAEGAATEEKISINFQSLTPDGTVRGNVILQRLVIKPNNTHDEKNKSASSHDGA